MPTITFRVDAGGVSVNRAVFVDYQLSAPQGHQMSISAGSIYNASVTLTAGSYTYKFRNGASGDWEDLAGQSCAVEASNGYARQLVVTSGQDSTVGPFCFGSCDVCLIPPPPPAPAAPLPAAPLPAAPLPAAPLPAAPRVAGGGPKGRRRVEQSYFPLWVVFVLGGSAFAGIALAGAHRRRERSKQSHEDGDGAASCKQLEPLDERFHALSLFQTSMVVVPTSERQPPRGVRAQSAPAGSIGQLRRRELELAESQARTLETMLLTQTYTQPRPKPL